MKKLKFKLPVKKIFFFTIIILALVFIIGYICMVFRSNDYFRIRQVINKEGRGAELSFLLGHNIFSVDLKAESRRILDYYPDSSAVRLARVLPDKIFVDFIKRKPVALIKLYRYFSVDKEGVIFYPPEPAQGTDLPVIAGLETKIFGPKPGKKYNIRELTVALNIIDEISRNRVARYYKIKKIDVASLPNASILMAKDEALLEVKMGPDKIKEKISILSNLLGQGKSDLMNIKYIDLRFKEAVLKLSDVKTK